MCLTKSEEYLIQFSPSEFVLISPADERGDREVWLFETLAHKLPPAPELGRIFYLNRLLTL